MKLGIIKITPEVLRAMLQLPDGSVIRDVRTDFYNRGVLELVIEGAGWEPGEGQTVRIAELATVHSEGDIISVNWNLPEED